MNITRRLQIIADIQPQMTLNIGSEFQTSTVSTLSRWTSVKRRWYGQNRQDVLHWIEETLMIAQKAMQTQIDIYFRLIQARNGLVNLRITYQSDQSFTDKIDQLISHLDQSTVEFQRQLALTLDELPKFLRESLTSNVYRTLLDSPHIIQTPIHSLTTLSPGSLRSPCTPPSSPRREIETLDTKRSERRISPLMINPFMIGYFPSLWTTSIKSPEGLRTKMEDLMDDID